MEIVFLGMNDIGWEVYEWLCDRERTRVQALATTEEQLDLVRKLQPDMVVASGFVHIIPPEIIAIPPEGCVNLHPGFLPHTRGYFPNVWSIVDDLPAGATLHYLDENIDEGDIISRREVDRHFSDSGEDVYRRIEDAAVELFKEAWPRIEDGEVDGVSQDESRANFYLREDFERLCEIDPSEQYQTKALVDRLRALTFSSYDNAYIEVDGSKYYLELDVTEASDSGAGDSAP